VAIKAGQILHDAQGFVVDRIQTGGVTNLNIPEEKIYELGNFKTVAITRDIPDLSFDVESLDVTPKIEALTEGLDPTATVAGDEFDFGLSKPLDIISPFRSAQQAFDIVRGIIIPSLNLETVVYRFGMRQNAGKTFTYRGDSVYYVPGTPYYQEFTVPVGPVPSPLGPYALTNAAIPYHEAGDTIYALGVCWVDPATGVYKRLFHGVDYTDTANDVTLLVAPPTGAKLKVVYGSLVAANYPQSVNDANDVSVKPAAVKGKDIDIYVETAPGSGVLARWTSVQSFEATRRVNLDNNEEFGNHHYVSQDYDTADVTGTVTVRPRDPSDLWSKIHQITAVPGTEIVGPNKAVNLGVEARVYDPEDHTLLMTLWTPDARFRLPNVQGRVQQKTEVPFAWTSDSGTLLAYDGARP
jgi:hypothetical protein